MPLPVASSVGGVVYIMQENPVNTFLFASQYTSPEERTTHSELAALIIDVLFHRCLRYMSGIGGKVAPIVNKPGS